MFRAVSCLTREQLHVHLACFGVCFLGRMWSVDHYWRLCLQKWKEWEFHNTFFSFRMRVKTVMLLNVSFFQTQSLFWRSLRLPLFYHCNSYVTAIFPSLHTHTHAHPSSTPPPGNLRQTEFSLLRPPKAQQPCGKWSWTGRKWGCAATSRRVQPRLRWLGLGHIC